MFEFVKEKNLENHWQWRLAKVIGIFLIVCVWIRGVLCIWAYFSFNPYTYALSQEKTIIWNSHTGKNIARSKMANIRAELSNVPNNQMYTVLSERAKSYETLKYLKIFVAILVFTGLIVLALSIVSRVVEYVIYGKKSQENLAKISQTPEENLENSEK